MYLILVTIAFLIPIDSLLVTTIIEKENHPTDFFALFIHLILLFILYFLFNYIYFNKKLLLIYCLLYSFFIEFFQILTGRGYEKLDILFNIFGVILAYFFVNFLKTNINNK